MHFTLMASNPHKLERPLWKELYLKGIKNAQTLTPFVERTYTIMLFFDYEKIII